MGLSFEWDGINPASTRKTHYSAQFKIVGKRIAAVMDSDLKSAAEVVHRHFGHTGKTSSQPAVGSGRQIELRIRDHNVCRAARRYVNLVALLRHRSDFAYRALAADCATVDNKTAAVKIRRLREPQLAVLLCEDLFANITIVNPGAVEFC
jgi:hypothetical protein